MPNNLIQRHIPEQDINKITIQFNEAAPLLAYIVKAIEDMEQSTRVKTMCDDFVSADWAYRQAYLQGQLKAFDFCKQLITR